VTQSPNAGSLLFDAFKTAFDRLSYRAAAWSWTLMPLPCASSSDGHRHHASHSPCLWTCPAQLVSLASHFGPHCLSSTSTQLLMPLRPLFSHSQCHAPSCRTPYSVVNIFMATLLAWATLLPSSSFINTAASPSTPGHTHHHLR
jgi:hypothetical protein